MKATKRVESFAMRAVPGGGLRVGTAYCIAYMCALVRTVNNEYGGPA